MQSRKLTLKTRKTTYKRKKSKLPSKRINLVTGIKVILSPKKQVTPEC
jgi:hypothetical protein